ncbi:jg21424, partial [Pararge aegeria aegeria]
MSDDGDDYPLRPKRKIKRVVVMSSSDSDGDVDVGVAESRRKRLRIVSDEDADDSSGSSVVRAGTRRRRALANLKDSETDSDSSGWATDRSDAPGPSACTSKPTSGFSSDSSEGNSDKCTICLLRFRNQEVGTPESCEHMYCLDCITEWSKNVNTCPVDRTVFNSIVVRACAGGRVVRTQPVRVEERRPSVEMFVIEDVTVCQVCRRSDGEDSMLLCDGCDRGYHMQCLTPPLAQVPADQWFCPNCPDGDTLQNISIAAVQELLERIMQTPDPPESRPSASRRPRNVRRSPRSLNAPDEPSTSTGRRRGRFDSNRAPTTSRGSGSTPRSTSLSTSASGRRTTTRRK